MPSFIILLALVVLTPLALAVLFPEMTETVYRWIVTGRTVIGAALLVVTVPLFISTGNLTLIAVAGVLAAYGLWRLWFGDTDAMGV